MTYDLLNTTIAGVIALVAVLGGILGLVVWAHGRHVKRLLREAEAETAAHLHAMREQTAQTLARMEQRAHGRHR